MSVTVPPNTSSWADAVTYGYYGDRTDPFPDEIYNVTEGDALPPSADREFVSFAPTTVSLAAAATGFDLTCQGTFPDDAANLRVDCAQPAMGGTTLSSSSVTKHSATEIVGHFPDAAGMVEGQAQVYIWVFPDDTAYPGSAFVTYAA